jgi:hypothetical protein
LFGLNLGGVDLLGETEFLQGPNHVPVGIDFVPS